VNGGSEASPVVGGQQGGETLRLAAWLASLDATSCNDTVMAHCRLVFADTVACMVGGLSYPEVERLATVLYGRGVRERFTGIEATSSDLALLLGFAGAALELDEGHYAAGGHPGVHAAAAVLAEAARSGASDEDCVLAFLAGYEAGGRVGEATRMRPTVHPHGTWGVVSAAVSVAWLRGYDATQMVAVINVASSLGLATSASAPLRGASVRSVWVGVAARNGMMACDLVEAGVSGEPDGCAAVFGGVIGSSFDAQRLTDRLGEYFLITGNFMKIHASCRETHGAVAALAAARGKARFNPDDVLRVEIETFADAARLSEAEPVSEMAARFSIQAAVAATILDGSIAVDSFAPGRLERPALKTLMLRVVVREVSDANAALPEVRICRCRIVLNDATVLTGEVHAAPGDSGSPLSIGELQAKFDALCARVTGQEGVAPATKALRQFLS